MLADWPTASARPPDSPVLQAAEGAPTVSVESAPTVTLGYQFRRPNVPSHHLSLDLGIYTFGFYAWF